MKGDDRRTQILECAKGIFARKGYYETQILDLVKELKISKGTPYQYFKNKEDLFLQLLHFIHDKYNNFTFDSNGLKKDNAYDFYYYRVAKLIYFFDSDPDIAGIILRMGPGINRSIEPIIEEIDRVYLDKIQTGVESGVEYNYIPSETDTELLSIFIYGAITRISYNYLVLKKGRKEPFDLKKLIDQTVEYLANMTFREGVAPSQV